MPETVSRARNLLFDLDGTLTDPRLGIVRSIVYALNELGHPAPPEEDLDRWIGPPLIDSFQELLGDRVEAARAVDSFRSRYGDSGLYENSVYPGIEDALRELSSAGARLFVATSKPEPFAIRIVEKFGLARYFDAVHGSVLTGERADKSDLLAHILMFENLQARASVMIGDRSHDIVAARANGLRSIGVTWGYGSEAELVAAGADSICSSVEGLVTRLSPVVAVP